MTPALAAARPRRTLITSCFAIIAFALLAAGCGSGTGVVATAPARSEAASPTTSEPEPTPEPEPAESAAPTTASEPARFEVGETVTITQNDESWADFSVLEVQEAAQFVDPDGFFNDTPTTSGYVFMAARVRYEALADGVDYNPFDFQVFVDGQAVDSVAFALHGPQPDLSSGTLPAGRSAEGWLLYEVPAEGEVLLSYGNVFLDEPPVFEFVLRDG